MLIIINIIILIHSTKKKLQKLFKKFSYGLFKLIYGSINGYQDIDKTPDSKVIISEINKDFRYKIYIVKNARLYTDTINDTAVIYDQKVIKEPSFQIRNTIFSQNCQTPTSRSIVNSKFYMSLHIFQNIHRKLTCRS